jgi:hypothetical protein
LLHHALSAGEQWGHEDARAPLLAGSKALALAGGRSAGLCLLQRPYNPRLHQTAPRELFQMQPVVNRVGFGYTRRFGSTSGNKLHRRGSPRAERTRGAAGEPEAVGLTANTKAQLDDGRIVNMEITEKQRAIEALRALPEHATIEDAIERLCFIAKIEEGLRQSDARQLVSHYDVNKQLLS